MCASHHASPSTLTHFSCPFSRLLPCPTPAKADFHSNQLSGPVPIDALAMLRLNFLNLSSNVLGKEGRHGGKEGVDAVRRGLPNCRAVLM